MARLLGNTLKTSGQLGVRVVDAGGHRAGLDGRASQRLTCCSAPSRPGWSPGSSSPARTRKTQEETLQRLEGIGFGFLVPIFFVVSGIRFELDALLSGGIGSPLAPRLPGAVPASSGARPTYAALRGSLAGWDPGRRRHLHGVRTAPGRGDHGYRCGTRRAHRSHRGSTRRRGHAVGAGVPPGSDSYPAGRTSERRGVEGLLRTVGNLNLQEKRCVTRQLETGAATLVTVIRLLLGLHLPGSAASAS